MARKVGRRGGNIVTIHDVARHVGVSPMTVSRVINGEKNVREETRAKVMASVEALNYSPNLAARSLATQDSARIGLLYSNPSVAFLSEFLLGILSESSQGGAQLLIESCEGPEGATTALEKMKAGGCDGVILSPPLSDSTRVARTLTEMNLPFVGVAMARLADDVSCVMIDDFKAAKAMTRRLLELGHRKIAFIKGPPNAYASQKRFEGFEAAMLKAGLEVEATAVAQGSFTYRSGFDAAERLLSQKIRPTAIFASNDDMAAGAVAAAHRLGLDVPTTVTVVGFDDTAMASSVWPELTTVRQPIADMAGLSVRVLLDAIRAHRQGRSFEPVREIRDFSLIERQSSANAAEP
ncbi:LacI family DNA-binding transcriptional regulator [Asticcacaulis sp. EMRT-3]|uniref:LacI family DNA-binding transcriptional regulator n=1 Tax=Asticcacaulis sp. EMRT-3 TaxID=3040349 RepID=UPI0024AF3DCD|nr:LacI family DNA-binding transcriptional regulator [Asticcacaulis sp. EMRT-3]MDI7775704.1 LacI family DNA-binding transcriptional regulator [Asticcacaulis sp. EMRT-3]